jgi:hypothetical protein
MLAAIARTATAAAGHEAVVAIVGGTMLTIALTRPRLRWVERLTEDSKPGRVWLERALTGFSFVMAGYAATTLLLTLHKQLGAESDALLNGAAWFLFAYAWLVHFEPFVNEWRLRGGVGAAALYTGLIFPAVVIGGTLAGVALDPHLIHAEVHLILLASVPAVLGSLVYWLYEPLYARLERLAVAIERAIDHKRRRDRGAGQP